MDEAYLRQGITGLTRTLDSGHAGSGRGWFAGHWPCAVIAAYYFCRDNPLEPGVEEAITREVDRLIASHAELFVPYAGDTGVAAQSVADIVHALEGSITRYVVGGHNVIYAAYAVQVLTEQPELVTSAVLNRIYALLDYFGQRTDGIAPREVFADGKGLTPEYASEAHMIQNVFTTLQYAPRLVDRGRILFDGHAMTHAHALVTLARLGYESVARRGHDAHRFHMEQNRDLQAQHLIERWTEKVTVDDHPFTLAFWERDFEKFGRQWEAGHVFKYLYSFYDLVHRIRDPFQKRCCELQLAYLI